MLKSVEVSAPGKVILHGEHSVVYGKEAIACSIEKRINCIIEVENYSKVITIKSTSDGKENTHTFECSVFSTFENDAITSKSLNAEQLRALKGLISSHDDSSIEAKLCLVCIFYYLAICSKFLQGSNKGLVIEINSELPLGAGLGSSASLCVCLSTAFLILTHGITPCNQLPESSSPDANIFSEEDLRLVNSWAFEGEKLLHGTPSGVDNSVVTFGGLVCFKNGVITHLPWSQCLEILLVYSKVPRNTVDMVKGVRDRYEQMPALYNALFDAIECLVRESKSNLLLLEKALKDSDVSHQCCGIFDRISDLVDINQNILKALGVSHDVIDSILRIFHSLGFKGKLTGAGGGGCVFTIIKMGHSEVQITEATKEIRKAGFDCWRVKIGGSGVKCIKYTA